MDVLSTTDMYLIPDGTVRVKVETAQSLPGAHEA